VKQFFALYAINKISTIANGNWLCQYDFIQITQLML
jgi:hypothetical protein